MFKNARTELGHQKTRDTNQILKTQEFRLPHQKQDTLADQLDIEIQCPRCKDIMELFSKLDLSYYCRNCRLELNVN
jgi:late competence protein required for DNA uptake (superfamily II DNA/RNA helicase)